MVQSVKLNWIYRPRINYRRLDATLITLNIIQETMATFEDFRAVDYRDLMGSR